MGTTSRAQLSGSTNLDMARMLSPKLRQFLDGNQPAYRVLTNCLAEAFTTRRMQVYYFYSDDNLVARASHYYPEDDAVCIVIRENQVPLDEYISLLFETINSMSEKHFLELYSEAKTGKISKDNFCLEISRTEFSADKMTRNLLKGIKMKKSETAKSFLYDCFYNCPDDFNDFRHYQKKVASRDIEKEWDEKYDWLRQP